jgi:hypothetical protein
MNIPSIASKKEGKTENRTGKNRNPSSKDLKTMSQFDLPNPSVEP